MPIIVTKTVEVRASPDRVFDFLADVTNWPRYAIHNVKGVRADADGTWRIDTPRGEARLILRPVRAHGLLDHEFIDASEGRWIVPARVVPLAGVAYVSMTFAKPDLMPADAFEHGMRLLEEELQTLKKVLEGK